ncbi:DUF6161 domain-containing protein [Mesorhizobium sp. M0136]|uniref:DUF6161 domain-containing protein n=1 Tax=Mesorhizobium sp. M0136 TaxID=2956890 RepID=UPI003336A8C7
MSIPVLTDEDVVAFVTDLRLDSRDAGQNLYQELVVLMIAAYLRATRLSGAAIDLYNNVRQLSVSIAMASARIESFLLVNGNPVDFDLPIAKVSARLGVLETQLGAFSTAVETEKENISALQIRFESLSRYGPEFTDKVASLNAEFDGLKASIEERLKLREATKLWGKNGAWAAFAFYLSGTILILTLASIPIGAFWFRQGILDFLQNIESAMVAGATGNSEVAATVSALGRLVLITSPLGFVVWLIRLLVRYNTRSLLLMDDARQRVTMLNTYLFLIEQDAAVKQDRGVILEALFRRPPGHGADSVDAPSFTELLRYGQENAPKAS